MSDRSSGDGLTVVVIVFFLFIVLAGGGAGIYFVQQQRVMAQRALMEAESARMVELEHRKLLEMQASEKQLLEDQKQGEQNGRRESIDQQINRVLDRQIAAWNEGDIEQFMTTYWQSEDLTFSSGGKTTSGWDQTLKRYRERYPDKDKMGTLRFANLQVTPLGREAALALGEWLLEGSEPARGNFSLVLKLVDGNWVIVHDHTSRLDAPPQQQQPEPITQP